MSRPSLRAHLARVYARTVSSSFSSGGERVWMSNGAAGLHVSEWQAALSRSTARATTAGRSLDAFFSRHLESAGLGMHGFDFGRSELADEGVRPLFSRLVMEIAQDIVDAAAGSPARRAWEFLAAHDAHLRATWVSWERVLVEWVARDVPGESALSIPEPLDTASHALELMARARSRFDRRCARETPTPAELEQRRQICALLSQVTQFLGVDLLREELLTLADVEEFLGQMSHAALHTRAAAELHDDADERELALEIAALRDPETNGAPD